MDKLVRCRRARYRGVVLIVGLAGRAGSGKSAVARVLAARPAVAWIDLDEVAWSTYRPGTDVFRRLAERFGSRIVAADGAIDRRALGRIAFGDEAARHDLERIVHPAVGQALRTLAAERRTKGTELLLVEGAVLTTSSYVDRDAFDLILWFEASEETRCRRLRGVGREAHVDRGSEIGSDPDVVRVDAEGSVEDVAVAVMALIEERSKGTAR